MGISSVCVSSPISLLAKSESCSWTAFTSLCVGSALGERDIYSLYLSFRMLWLYIQDTAFIPECQVTIGPKVPINSSVLPTREFDSQEHDDKGLFLFSRK